MLNGLAFFSRFKFRFSNDFFEAMKLTVALGLFQPCGCTVYYKIICTSIRTPVISNTTAKAFFNFAASSVAAKAAPTGANSTVSGTIHKNPTKLIKPNVPAGASLGVLPKRSIVNAAGKEMIKPIAAAVPTALWVG